METSLRVPWTSPGEAFFLSHSCTWCLIWFRGGIFRISWNWNGGPTLTSFHQSCNGNATRVSWSGTVPSKYSTSTMEEKLTMRWIHKNKNLRPNRNSSIWKDDWTLLWLLLIQHLRLSFFHPLSRWIRWKDSQKVSGCGIHCSPVRIR